MSVYEYIQVVKTVLESLEAPEIVELDNFESLNDRTLHHLKKAMPKGGILNSIYYFDFITPDFFNDKFKAVAEVDGVVWAYWKTVQIPELMELALADYFARDEDWLLNSKYWRELGEVMLENVYASNWPDHCFRKPSNCTICSGPMWRFITTSCGHSYHLECFERWIINEEKNTCPLCREIL